jgi:hypothetical protein
VGRAPSLKRPARPLHLIHLKADLSGEMRRVADYLDIHVSPDIWPRLVEAAGFKAMRRDGATLMGAINAMLQGGSDRFFHKGTNERWRRVFREEDLALYDAKVEAMFSPACARWVARGRLEAGDPRSSGSKKQSSWPRNPPRSTLPLVSPEPVLGLGTGRNGSRG